MQTKYYTEMRVVRVYDVLVPTVVLSVAGTFISLAVLGYIDIKKMKLDFYLLGKKLFDSAPDVVLGADTTGSDAPSVSSQAVADDAAATQQKEEHKLKLAQNRIANVQDDILRTTKASSGSFTRDMQSIKSKMKCENSLIDQIASKFDRIDIAINASSVSSELVPCDQWMLVRESDASALHSFAHILANVTQSIPMLESRLQMLSKQYSNASAALAKRNDTLPVDDLYHKTFTVIDKLREEQASMQRALSHVRKKLQAKVAVLSLSSTGWPQVATSMLNKIQARNKECQLSLDSLDAQLSNIGPISEITFARASKIGVAFAGVYNALYRVEALSRFANSYSERKKAYEHAIKLSTHHLKNCRHYHENLKRCPGYYRTSKDEEADLDVKGCLPQDRACSEYIVSLGSSCSDFALSSINTGNFEHCGEYNANMHDLCIGVPTSCGDTLAEDLTEEKINKRKDEVMAAGALHFEENKLGVWYGWDNDAKVVLTRSKSMQVQVIPIMVTHVKELRGLAFTDDVLKCVLQDYCATYANCSNTVQTFVMKKGEMDDLPRVKVYELTLGQYLQDAAVTFNKSVMDLCAGDINCGTESNITA